MPIEMSTFLGGMTNSVYSVTGFNKIFSSVAYTSIILSVIILIILMFIYPCKKDTPSWILLKVLLYVFIINIAILSLHNSIIKNDYKEKYLNTNIDTFMTNINNRDNAIYEQDNVKVMPNFVERTEYVSGGSPSPVKREFSSTKDILDDIEKRI